MLVEPDRHLWTQPPDESIGDQALGLGKRSRPRVERAGQPLPPEWHVAIQVDAMRVPPRLRDQPVGVQHGNNPESEASRRCTFQLPRDRNAGGLVAVNASNDELAS